MTRVAAVLGCQPSVVSMFVKLDSVFTTQTLSSVAAGHFVPFITLEPWTHSMHSGQILGAPSLAAVSAGASDQALTRIAGVIAAYPGLVYLRYAHEMNGTWYPWSARANGGSASLYVASWRHVHDLFIRAGARNVRWVWAPVALPTGPNGPAGNLSPMYPGNAYVDDVGFTGYAHGATTARQTFGSWIQAVQGFSDRPVILAEIGADGAHKSDWITSLADYIERSPSIVGFIWFNTTPATTGASGYYRIDDNPRQVSAFKSTLKQLHVRCTSAAVHAGVAPTHPPG